MPFTLTLYKHVYSVMIVPFRYRISENHTFALMYIISGAAPLRSKGVDPDSFFYLPVGQPIAEKPRFALL
ncbi:hypothetical protein C3432_09000 [Citrobacter amalonaticus]|uniref:Uncharacterized protein n=1 Tax=Citrobacter amalonaticus TaxID=35703 RepID=A0A2S4RZE9_CITAM|nr:hypothetical protein C3432_09000 [Citrobacter amalonaticus]POT76425.1 hypothetical protein C3436_02825 [Citrobacter amalonaticus]POU66576.1 hypothetical protein C3430_07200 [Citrobacter amalonaticus]POV05660.1 hypothetical protein C3424_10130 [Citrobacter amalonaticus]